ncbi:hypothetical protein J7U46_22845, partial [Pelomonas sp. V22]|uniref:hypothetical protein n=1 Tax=Pelomonas sp. V22 TaxID=2822139 RepID=UPI0024A84FEC
NLVLQSWASLLRAALQDEAQVRAVEAASPRQSKDFKRCENLESFQKRLTNSKEFSHNLASVLITDRCQESK